MNCSRSEELFADYLDERLGRPETIELERHFARCESCPGLLTEYRNVVRGLRALQAPAPSDELESKILGTVLPRVKARAEFLPLPSWRTFAGWAAAACFLFLLIGPSTGSPSQGRIGQEVSQTTHRLYSFGVRAYRESERLVDELNVLRMTVGVAFEDRIDELSERLRALEEIQRRREPAEQSYRGGPLEVASAPIAPAVTRSHL